MKRLSYIQDARCLKVKAEIRSVVQQKICYQFGQHMLRVSIVMAIISYLNADFKT